MFPSPGQIAPGRRFDWWGQYGRWWWKLQAADNRYPSMDVRICRIHREVGPLGAAFAEASEDAHDPDYGRKFYLAVVYGDGAKATKRSYAIDFVPRDPRGILRCGSGSSSCIGYV